MRNTRRTDRNGAPARRWYVRLGAALVHPLTMFQGSSGKWSMFRCGWAYFAFEFGRNFPAANEWTAHSVAALVTLTFALPAESLFGRIPVSETLGAIQAFFSAVTAKGVDKARGYYESYRYSSPAPGEPPRESSTPPAET